MAASGFLRIARPRVHDWRGFELWLAQAPLGEPGRATRLLLDLLDSLHDRPPAPADYLRILERLRPVIDQIAEQQSKRFAARALPLAPGEADVFTQICDLRLALLEAYRSLVQPLSAASGTPAALALVRQRAIVCGSALLESHFLARREPDAVLWRGLHQAYAQEESCGAESREITAVNGRSAYARLLLLALADPFGLSARQLAWTLRWSERFARKVGLYREPPADGGWAVDLDGDRGPQWMPPQRRESLRYLERAALAHSLARRIRKLRAGAEPAQLGLGSDCSTAAALDLLHLLARAWLEPPAAPAAPDRVEATVEVIGGLAAIHRALGGTLPARESRPWEYSRQNAEQLHIFQHTARSDATAESRDAPAVPAELWQAFEVSPQRWLLRRAAAGARIAHRQLLALRSAGASALFLGEVAWLRENRDRSLAIAVQRLAQSAAPCAVRPLDAEQLSFQPALVLHAAGGHGELLALPCGGWQSERGWELRLGERRMQVRLTGSVRRGPDYELAGFSALR